MIFFISSRVFLKIKTKLYIPAIKLNLNANLRILLRYFKLKILKRFSLANTCSILILILLKVLLHSFWIGVNWLYLLFLNGKNVFLWIFCIHW